MKKLITVVFMVMTMSLAQAQDNLTQTTIQTTLSGNQGQVIQLAEAFSEEQYDWRPTEGISSVGEALLHVAGGNYYLASKMGYAPPEDVDMMNIKKITGKANIIAALKKSNAFVLETILKVNNASLSEEVDFGYAKMNKLGGLLAMMEHNAEHKGQLIAYARSNDVVPPWSVKEE